MAVDRNPTPIQRGALPGQSRVLVGLVSDTHIPEARGELWPEVFSAFRGVDLILHGGDLHDLKVLDQLSDVAPTYAARGNGEDGSAGRAIAPDDPRLKASWILDIAGLHVGMTHDLPIPECPPHLTVERWMQRRFGGAGLDIIVYGHTHVEGIDLMGTTLCINPGSPTFPHNLECQLGTVGFLDIVEGRVHASIWQLTADDPVALLELSMSFPTALPQAGGSLGPA